MKRYLFAGLLLWAVALLNAGEVKFPTVKGYVIDDKIDYFDVNTLFNQINGAADVYLDYGFVEMYHAVYKRKGGDGYIVAEAYRHGNPDLAFGMYVTERTGATHLVDIGAQGYAEEGVLNVSGGDWYLKIYSHRKDAATATAMRAIAEGLEKELFPNAAIPAEIAWFPAEGRVAGSDLYVAKEVLGHPFLTEAYTSSYNNGNYELFLFKKQSPEAVAEMIAAYREWAKSGSDAAQSGLMAINDRYNGTVYLLPRKNYAAMVVGVEDAAQAAALLEKLLQQVN